MSEVRRLFFVVCSFVSRERLKSQYLAHDLAVLRWEYGLGLLEKNRFSSNFHPESSMPFGCNDWNFLTAYYSMKLYSRDAAFIFIICYYSDWDWVVSCTHLVTGFAGVCCLVGVLTSQLLA